MVSKKPLSQRKSTRFAINWGIPNLHFVYLSRGNQVTNQSDLSLLPSSLLTVTELRTYYKDSIHKVLLILCYYVAASKPGGV